MTRLVRSLETWRQHRWNAAMQCRQVKLGQEWALVRAPVPAQVNKPSPTAAAPAAGAQ